MPHCQGCGLPITRNTDAIPWGSRDWVCSHECGVEADRVWVSGMVASACGIAGFLLVAGIMAWAYWL